MTTFLERSAWTTTSAGGSTLSGSILKGVAIHYPGSPQDVIGDPGQAGIASRLRGYRDYHVNTRGWSDIGYNFAIDQGGRVWMCRSTLWKGNRVGAHCASATNQDANQEYVGVLLIIGDQETPTAKMITAFRDWYFNRFLPGWPGRTDVRGHGKVPGASTACPGSRTLALIAEGVFSKPIAPGDDMPLDQNDLNNIYAVVRNVLNHPTDGFKVFGNQLVNRNGDPRYPDGKIPAIQELADAKTIAMRIEAKVDALSQAVAADEANDITLEQLETLYEQELADKAINVQISVDGEIVEPTP